MQVRSMTIVCVVSLAWLGVACSNPDPAAPPQTRICAQDRRSPSYVVQLDQCEDSLHCPSGTRCVGPPRDRSCQIDPALEATPDLLGVGFGAPVFEDITVRPGEYSLDPPASALRIACALFRCLPEFDDNEDDERRITNFDQCVVQTEELDARRTTAIVAEMSWHVPQGRSSCGLAPEEEEEAVTYEVRDYLGHSRANGLWFGCWAYDELRIVGTTRLRDVRADVDVVVLVEPGECVAGCTDDRCEVCSGVGCPDDPEDVLAFPESYEWLTDYAGCIRDDRNGTGACVAGHCRGWCREDDDCLSRECRTMGGEDCDMVQCEKDVPGSILGLCAPPPPPPNPTRTEATP